jgi:hypothetical protein
MLISPHKAGSAPEPLGARDYPAERALLEAVLHYAGGFLSRSLQKYAHVFGETAPYGHGSERSALLL